MFPYRDELQTIRRPYVTMSLIAANVVAWVLVQGAGAPQPVVESVCDLGLIPGELTGLVAPGTSFPLGAGYACVTEAGRHVSHVFTSMFLHGSWVHLLGNMWFLCSMGDATGEGVAFWAHVGGFTAGILLVRVFVRADRVAARDVQRWRPKHVLWG